MHFLVLQSPKSFWNLAFLIDSLECALTIDLSENIGIVSRNFWYIKPWISSLFLWQYTYQDVLSFCICGVKNEFPLITLISLPWQFVCGSSYRSLYTVIYNCKYQCKNLQNIVESRYALWCRLEKNTLHHQAEKTWKSAVHCVMQDN